MPHDLPHWKTVYGDFEEVAYDWTMAEVAYNLTQPTQNKTGGERNLAPPYSTAKALEPQKVELAEAMTHINAVWVASATF